MGTNERDLPRYTGQTGEPARCLGEVDNGIELKMCTVRKKICCTGPTIRAAKAEQKSLVPARHALRNQPRKGPFHLSSCESLFTSVSTLGFKSQQGPSLSSLSGPSFLSSFGSSCQYQEFFCPALTAIVRPIKKIISIHLSPSPQKAGQAVVQGRLSLVAMMCTQTF
jgi:hypothetical protein